MEDIPTNLKNIFFLGCESREWATWDGHSIDIVIGMDNADLFPMPLAWRDSLILSKSILSNLLIVWGREERVQRLDLGRVGHPFFSKEHSLLCILLRSL